MDERSHQDIDYQTKRKIVKQMLNTNEGLILLDLLKYTYDHELLADFENENRTYFALGARSVYHDLLDLKEFDLGE